MDTPISETHPLNEEQSRALLKRYFDAYMIAKITTAFGSGLKTVGKGLAILIGIIAFLLGSGLIGHVIPAVVASVVVGAFIGSIPYVFGVFISAHGQMLRASLDTAVHSSPFLSSKQRLIVMSLPTQ